MPPALRWIFSSAMVGFLPFLLGPTCTVRQGVEWLPDSSGFVYPEKDGKRISLYRLQDGESKVIEPETLFVVSQAGISPNGQKVAYAQLSRSADKHKSNKLRVVIVGLDGKTMQETPWFDWSLPSNGDDNADWSTTASWAPISLPTEKVVVSGDLRSAIIDLTTNRMIKLEGNPSGNGIHPGGKGLLVFGGDSFVSFVDWDGNLRPISTQPANGVNLNGALIPNFHWQGDTLYVRTPLINYQIDVAARVLTTQPASQAQFLELEEGVMQTVVFPANGNKLRTVLYRMNATQEESKTFCRIELLKPYQVGKECQPPVLILQGVEGLPYLYPSPDGKLVAIRTDWLTGKFVNPAIQVVDSNGTIMAGVSVAEPAKQ